MAATAFPARFARLAPVRSSLTTQPSPAAKSRLLYLIADQDHGLKSSVTPLPSPSLKPSTTSLPLAEAQPPSMTTFSATWCLLRTTKKEQLFIAEKPPLFGTKMGDVLWVIDVSANSQSNVITLPRHGAFLVRAKIKVASEQRVNFKFDTVYPGKELRVVKDIRGDYLIVERAPYNWKE